MTDADTTVISDLKDALAEENTALRMGQLYDLDGLTQRKDRLAQALQEHAGPLDETELKALAAQAAHNASMLQAARQGVETVRKRVAEALTLSRGEQTYGGDGKRRHLNSRRPTADKSY